MKSPLRAYLCELAGTAIMMAIGVGAIVLLWAPGSPVARIELERLRLFVTGLFFAGGAAIVVYSPLGRTSGAHLNPAVTCAFWRLGRIGARDAAAYAVAQTLGALVGVLAVRFVAGDLAASVRLGMTTPGPGVSPAAAAAYEGVITFALMFLILACLHKPRLAPRTGLVAGLFVATLVMIEAPLTGTSVNPARSLAPAMVMQRLDGVWIYLVAPTIGALAAAAVWRGRLGVRQSMICAKLYHGGARPCQFATCPYIHVRRGDAVIREGDRGDTAYVIESGEVEVRRGDMLLGRLGPGDWYGEMSVLLGEPRSATVVALTDGRARRLTREAFEQALADNPAHALELLRQLAARLHQTDRRLAASGTP